MECVKEALDSKAWESGHVTGNRLKEILEDYKKNSIEAIDHQLHETRAELRQLIQQSGWGSMSGEGGYELGGVEGIDLESFRGGGVHVKTFFPMIVAFLQSQRSISFQVQT